MLKKIQVLVLLVLGVIILEVSLCVYLLELVDFITFILVLLASYTALLSYILCKNRDRIALVSVQKIWYFTLSSSKRAITTLFVLLFLSAVGLWIVCKCSYAIVNIGIFEHGLSKKSTFTVWVMPTNQTYSKLNQEFSFLLPFWCRGQDLTFNLMDGDTIVSEPLTINVARKNSLVFHPKKSIAPHISKFEIIRFHGATSTKVGEIGKTVFSVKKNDSARITAEFDRPLYAYIIAFNPDGSPQPCSPEEEGTIPVRTDKIVYPKKLKYGFRFTDGIGCQVFLLLATDKQLPNFKEWKERITLPSFKEINIDGLWHYDGKYITNSNRNVGVLISKDMEPFVALCQEIRDLYPLAAINAFAFPVHPADLE